MDADFYELQKNIKDYITESYKPIALSLYNLSTFDKSIMSFPDIDRERVKKALFFDFDDYSFEVLTLESALLTGYLDLYITLRGSATPQSMTEEASKYATVFFKLIDDEKTLGGIVDEAVIERINFYDHAEGNINYKAAKLKIKFSKEYN
ncbi:hypothetical protein E4O04_08915 [Treponema sp. OMZ 799]|uniref:hypothetical protein n=1 Tax=Treponema sp. OMZ 799 TaxID=2563668 RepID=UPI0020A35496|nr:hypothetical protein [Treponema sp. OMZ 799]UTC78112.1 hypothetical protein E4O04_08915 [Treponema sp. OMZ 799]